jgi:hypothetical protein
MSYLFLTEHFTPFFLRMAPCFLLFIHYWFCYCHTSSFALHPILFSSSKWWHESSPLTRANMLLPCPSNPTRVCRCVYALSSFHLMPCCPGSIGTQSLQPFHNTTIYRRTRKRCQRLNTHFSVLFPSLIFEIAEIGWWTELLRLIFLFGSIDDL